MDNSDNFDDFLTPGPSPTERGESYEAVKTNPGYLTGSSESIHLRVQMAKSNRKEATQAEAILWQNLRNRKLGEKFRMQHPVGNYIPDFVCLVKRVIVEVDGEYHNNPKQMELDENRTLELEQKYLFKVIRFKNEEVLKNLESVLERIKFVLSQRKTN